MTNLPRPYAIHFGEERPGEEYWYRYRDITTGGDEDGYGCHAEIILDRFRVSSVTKQGVWISTGYAAKKFVLRGARKRWACPTKEEAMVSFIARKKRQLGLLRAQARHVEEVLELCRDCTDCPERASHKRRAGLHPDFKALEARDWGR